MRKAFYLCVVVFVLLMGILFYVEFAASNPAASAAKESDSTASAAFPTDESPQMEIEGILQRYYEIARTNDREALSNYSREITAPEYRYSSELGVKDKTEALRLLDSRGVKFLETELKDLTVQVHGDTAVAKYLDVSETKPIGKRTTMRQSTRFTNVWLKRDGQWRVAAEHSSVLAPPKLLPRHPLADNIAKK